MVSPPAIRDGWTAPLLSLAVPGAGQLWRRQPSCLAWFAAAAVLIAAPGLGLAPRWLPTPALLVLALLSARHARPRGPAVSAPAVEESGRWPLVRLSLRVDLPRPSRSVWPTVGDLGRFACHDPFHRRVVVLAPKLRPGAALMIEHRAFGVTVKRFGRLLWWRDGQGYAFSDLSARGPRRGFPHVFIVDLSDDGTGASRLTVEVRGRWTARLVPRPAARLWLRAVMAQHARLIRAALAETADV